MCAEQNKAVLAMYDVRGIQDYVFRTAKVRDAIGASASVEDIIADALKEAVGKIAEEDGSPLKCDIEWEGETGPEEFSLTDGNGDFYDVQVLYIGGGNAFVIYKERPLCIRINKIMARYVLEETYSLQLAAAVVERSGDYSVDYRNVFNRMNSVKAKMSVSRPLGTLPVMEMELKTGYPVSPEDPKSADGRPASRESVLKKRAEREKRKDIDKILKKFSTYETEKGTDSTIAVVHLDGNNMGLRIRSLIEKERDYETAVNKMRHISYNINHSYKDVFADMEEKFNAGERNFILKILTAGDDITYVTNGKAAVASVEYFAEEIAKRSMYREEEDEDENIRKYGFSVCAGIAFMHSHFPFSVAYDIAENCCGSAKKKAKKEENTDGGKIGNWFDFHICKNSDARDLKETRRREYMTGTGENLLIRPYELPLLNLPEREKAYDKYESLKEAIEFFRRDSQPDQPAGTETAEPGKGYLPKSHAKTLRNTYSLGRPQVERFLSFLQSRNRTMPDGSLEAYISGDGSSPDIARWYDALELMDDYEPLEIFLSDDAAQEDGEEREEEQR